MQETATAVQNASAANPDRPTALPLRDDTFLGVCEALGEDFGFNPIWLRVALAAGLLWNVEAVLVFYLALAVAVAISRLIFPKPRVAPSAATDRGCNDESELPLAA